MHPVFQDVLDEQSDVTDPSSTLVLLRRWLLLLRPCWVVPLSRAHLPIVHSVAKWKDLVTCSAGRAFSLIFSAIVPCLSCRFVFQSSVSVGDPALISVETAVAAAAISRGIT